MAEWLREDSGLRLLENRRLTSKQERDMELEATVFYPTAEESKDPSGCKQSKQIYAAWSGHLQLITKQCASSIEHSQTSRVWSFIYEAKYCTLLVRIHMLGGIITQGPYLS